MKGDIEMWRGKVGRFGVTGEMQTNPIKYPPIPRLALPSNLSLHPETNPTTPTLNPEP